MLRLATTLALFSLTISPAFAQQGNHLFPEGPTPELPAAVREVVEGLRSVPSTGRVMAAPIGTSNSVRERLMNSSPDAGGGSTSPLLLRLFDGEVVTVTPTRRQDTGQTFRWSGKIADTAGPDQGSAQFRVRAGRLEGTVFHNGKKYEVQSVPDTTFAVVREINTGALPPDHTPEFEERTQAPALTPQNLQDTATSPAGKEEKKVHEITAIIFYSTKANDKVIKAKLDTSMDNFIDSILADAADSFENSGIENVNITATKKAELTDFKETGTWNTDRDAFFNHADAKKQRHDAKADVAILILDNENVCGEVVDLNVKADQAFGVVHWDCAKSVYSLIHEVAHLFGAGHDAEHSKNSHYTYGHGFWNKDDKDKTKNWRTIMSYADTKKKDGTEIKTCGSQADCPRIPWWSTPDKTYPVGAKDAKAMGSKDKHDNARVLRERAKAVSEFK